MPLRGKDRMKKNLRTKGDQLVRAVGFEALGRLMRRTPVRKGRARANWNVAVGSIDRAENAEATTADVGAKQAAGMQVIGAFAIGGRLFITNSVPYIGRLEDGSSKQAPQGMVKVTAAEMRPLVARVAAKIASGE